MKFSCHLGKKEKGKKKKDIVATLASYLETSLMRQWTFGKKTWITNMSKTKNQKKTKGLPLLGGWTIAVWGQGVASGSPSVF